MNWKSYFFCGSYLLFLRCLRLARYSLYNSILTLSLSLCFSSYSSFSLYSYHFLSRYASEDFYLST